MHRAAMRSGLVTALFLVVTSTAAVADCPPGSQCTGGDCCAPDCTFSIVGTPCTDDGNVCTADSCDGAGVCLHVPEPSGTPCTDDGNVCTTDQCDGTGTCSHPPDQNHYSCRAAAGPCDVAETCDGTATDCPPDTLAPPTLQCRSSAGDCDPAEFCTGSSASCPDDVLAVGTVCRAAAGVCDVAETCDGTAPACPADGFAAPTVVCRAAAGPCDAAEACTGSTASCPPDLPQPNGTPCNDGNACTRTDSCLAGICTGTDRLICGPLDTCHLAGVCNPLTGVCSNPPKPDGAPCNDGNDCTRGDSCHGGLCTGVSIGGCCLVDDECDDGVACTEDRCTSHTCVHSPVDRLCGAASDCATMVCVPSDPAADDRGCITRATSEATYCTEDEDPCTIDVCRSGTCRHVSDGSGDTCPPLAATYRAILDLLRNTRDLEAALQATAACPVAGPGCDIVSGANQTRLATLLVNTADDLEGAGMALAGRLAGPPSPDVQRDPSTRVRTALGLLGTTPGKLRTFLTTLTRARATHAVTPSFARARRGDALRLLRGTKKVRRDLQALLVRRLSFAR